MTPFAIAALPVGKMVNLASQPPLALTAKDAMTKHRISEHPDWLWVNPNAAAIDVGPTMHIRGCTRRARSGRPCRDADRFEP